MKVIALVIIKFLFISALFIVSNGNLYLKESEQRDVFFQAYSNWISGVFSQGMEVAGYVINSRWLPENSSS
ncbi:hypothetical protein FJZ20_01350 [Candidatus Pacearchaeota archaeon]|nr:hypothetical protein [Candidatus Pacearchaeota archaeon]